MTREEILTLLTNLSHELEYYYSHEPDNIQEIDAINKQMDTLSDRLAELTPKHERERLN